MFQSHLDEQPIMTMTNGLGADAVPAEAGSKDVTIPQPADTLGKYKPVITIVLIAAISYMILKAMKNKKIAPKITGKC